MKKTLILLSFFILSSCIREDSPEIEEKEPVQKEPEKEPFQSICDFDMSAKQGEFSLEGRWEFVGFENLKTGDLGEKDLSTCTARWAYHAMHEKEENNTFQILLTLGDQTYVGEEASCQDKNELEALGFYFQLKSCYQANGEGIINIEVDGAYHSYDQATIFPYIEFNQNYFQALEEVNRYEIESNRLYLYFGSNKYRLAYLAVEAD